MPIKLRFYIYVALYGCETWSLTLRKKSIEGICEQNAEENIQTVDRGSNRKLHNHRGLHNFYSLSNIIRVGKSRRMIQAGHVA
jgi:hypothetical protein